VFPGFGLRGGKPIESPLPLAMGVVSVVFVSQCSLLNFSWVFCCLSFTLFACESTVYFCIVYSHCYPAEILQSLGLQLVPRTLTAFAAVCAVECVCSATCLLTDIMTVD